MTTTLSIFRSAASELFIHFDTREDAYNWGLSYLQYWGKDVQFSPYEKMDSSVWGSPIGVDSYYELFIFTGKDVYDRSEEWYITNNLGFHVLDNKMYAFMLGLKSEPCSCDDPCGH